MNLRQLLNQIVRFLLVSGTGWLVDFTIYIVLTLRFNFDVMPANILAAIPAITFVFIVSTRQIFIKKKSIRTLKVKYLIYFIYQMIFLVIISALGQFLYSLVILHIEQTFVLEHAKLIVKIFITGITVTVNFIFMKVLVEKL